MDLDGKKHNKRMIRRAIIFAIYAYISMKIYEGIVDASPEIFYDTVDFVQKHGYPVESHEVVTKDGYILTIHRIPHGRNDSHVHGRPVVLLQHGIMSSSDSWVLRGPDKDLAFMMVDAGFDVWLGNARGNDYSHKHKYLPISSEIYWEFSWHEMGYYDLPAMIDYILENTSQPKLSYVGFSMGCNMFFVLGSTHPEYNDKINVMVGMGPAASLQDMTFFNTFGIQFLKTLSAISRFLGRYRVLSRTTLRSYFMNVFCRDDMILTQHICVGIGKSIAGRSQEQTNSTILPIIYSHVPAGISIHTLDHFVQISQSRKFSPFNWGEAMNLKIYNSAEPPPYDLHKVQVPIVLHYSDSDVFVNKTTVEKLASHLPNVVKIRRVPSISDFNHDNFVWGTDANRLLYDDIVDTLKYFR